VGAGEAMMLQPFLPKIHLGDIFYIEVVRSTNRSAQKGFAIPVEIVDNGITCLILDQVWVRPCFDGSEQMIVSIRDLLRKVEE
jgi:hypothetical protein